MFCKVSLIIVSLAYLFRADNFSHGLKYRVPLPQIQVFTPKGFKISIPDNEGIRLFAFHGNLNTVMHGLEAGHWSKDIIDKTGNSWVFEDPETSLKIGDKIYYWVFVIRNELGYRYDHGYYEVTQLLPLENHKDQIETSNITENSVKSQELCQRLILNLTATLLDMEHEIRSLRESNDILRDTLEKNANNPKLLVLSGKIPFQEDPVSFAQDVISMKLGLPIQVSKAVTNNNSITFEVGSLTEKIKILRTAKEKLKYSKIIISN